MSTVIERAFELAASGEYKTVEQVLNQLRKDGHRGHEPMFSGKAIRDQLRAIMKTAKASAGPSDRQPNATVALKV